MSTTLDNLEPYQIRSCDGYGQLNPKFMFVGISAGKLGALKTSVPFTKDGSGRLLQRVLYCLGLSKSNEKSLKPELVNCWITNLVKGRILDKNGNNRLPTKKEVNYWWNDFCQEVNRVNPEKIIAVGKLVYKQLNDNLDFSNIYLVNHPRYYASHGALDYRNIYWQFMMRDYSHILGIPIGGNES